MRALVKGDQGGFVEAFQQALELMGYDLPKWGADGIIGWETIYAAEEFAEDFGIPDVRGDIIIPAAVVQAALADNGHASPEAPTDPEPGGTQWADIFVDRRHEHRGKRRRRRISAQRKRPADPEVVREAIASVRYICLHQTAVDMGSSETTRDNMAIHWLALRNGRGLFLNGYQWRIAHGHGWNKDSVGIEVSGHFEGVEGDRRTHWVPSRKPEKWTQSTWRRYLEKRRIPMGESSAQTILVRQIIRHIDREVTAAGGKIEGIVSHRQSFGPKTSDPGSMIWRTVALEMERELGFGNCGNLTRKSTGRKRGRPVPQAWDPRQAGISY